MKFLDIPHTACVPPHRGGGPPMRYLRTMICLGVLVVVGILTSGPPAYAQITGATITKNAGNSADEFQDGLLSSFQRTSTVAITLNNGLVLRTRYAEIVGTDTGIFTSRTENMSSDYTVAFNVTAPVGYELTVTTSMAGALTLVDDGSASATANISAVAPTVVGGVLVGGNIALTPNVAQSTSSNSSQNVAI